ncbi:hypothetical protein F4775DRAFT_536905 [Biscogniauxia sp. FL1348]|nr:hypothetical protein F4775DRAFT_536905 [Biscogniauxia sp. FL1348]
MLPFSFPFPSFSSYRWMEVLNETPQPAPNHKFLWNLDPPCDFVVCMCECVRPGLVYRTSSLLRWLHFEIVCLVLCMFSSFLLLCLSPPSSMCMVNLQAGCCSENDSAVSFPLSPQRYGMGMSGGGGDADGDGVNDNSGRSGIRGARCDVMRCDALRCGALPVESIVAIVWQWRFGCQGGMEARRATCKVQR